MPGDQVAPCGGRIDARFLEGNSDAAPNGYSLPNDVKAGNMHRPGIRQEQRGQDADRSRLA
jgi:hypothetical protein